MGMRALGLCIDIPPSKKPTLRAVLLEDSLGSDQTPSLSDMNVLDTFDVAATGGDLAEQLKELSHAITGRVESLRPDIVVVRRADRSPRPSNLDGPRFRLMFEGAVAAASRSLVPQTVIRTGKECGAAYGKAKADLDADAETFSTRRPLIPAVAAAMSGLTADRH
jgi:hypothetical protein